MNPPNPPLDLNPEFTASIQSFLRWANRWPLLLAVLAVCATILLAPRLAPPIDSSTQRAEIQRIIYQTSGAGIPIPDWWREPAISQARIQVANFILLNETWLRRTRNTERFASILSDLVFIEDSLKCLALLKADQQHQIDLERRPETTRRPADYYQELLAPHFTKYPALARDSYQRDLYPLVQVYFQSALNDLVATINDIDKR
jgi:hypothetical protein